MKLPRALAAPLVAAWLSGSTCAMTIERVGDTVWAAGAVTDDLRAFEDVFAAGPVRRVVFVDSPGGDLWTGLQVGRLLARHEVDTAVAGSCLSACSLMFLGGRERRFTDTFAPGRTLIGLHGAHRTETMIVDPVLQPQLFAWFKARMGERFDSEMVNRALYDMDDPGGMLRLYDRSRSPKPVTTHCRGAQTPRKQCAEFPLQDALSLGVITEAAALQVELPPAFKPARTVFGQSLGEPLADVPEWLSREARRACRVDDCQARILDWPNRRDHWALAVAPAGGWGRSEGADTAQLAAIHALYRCNHRRDASVLCELRGVSGALAAEAVAHAEELHAAALQALQIPSTPTWADEEYGGDFTSAGKGLRTERLVDVTPKLFDGVRTVTTAELASRLKAPRPLKLIDVGGATESIPGSLALWNGGQALADVAADEALAGRFTRLLALLAPDRSAEVAFYCGSRNCWLAVNAARRAAAAGWRQVLWYRGGLESWRAAGLPLVPPVVRAVAN